jgi:hypothetical protein
MSGFRTKFTSIVVLLLTFKKGIIDGSKSDAELCRLYFDLEKGKFEYLKYFEFTDRRNVRNCKLSLMEIKIHIFINFRTSCTSHTTVKIQ